MRSLDDPSDYRYLATVESSRLANADTALPRSLSLCLANQDNSANEMWWFSRMVLLRLLLGICGLIAGASIAYWDTQDEDFSPLLAVAMACTTGGILLLISNGFFQRRFTRRVIGSRYFDLVAISTEFDPVCVSIENAATFEKIKVIPEDLGYLGIDSREARIAIEGAVCRYVICANDVIEISEGQGGTSTATVITYQVGPVQLTIAIQFDSVWHEVKKNFGARKDPLIECIRTALNRGNPS